ncbi:MAG: ATP-grasp domain-containing protein [Spirochaetales bacterium]|nr:ATP-grasp domain-containing protein [Spirochaetales bacterium]
MRKTVFILGGSTMQLPSIRIAKEKGWRVIVADGNPRAEGRALADHFAHIDLKDLAAMEKTARYYNELFGLNGIFTAGTDFSTTVAYVAQKLNLPGIPYEAACNATDKAQMRSVLKAGGVPCPDFFIADKTADPHSILRSLRLPLVVKPVDNMGARGVRRVDSAEELGSAIGNAVFHSRSGRAIVEEFIDGRELSLDAIIYDNTITVCGIADRHICFPPYFVEMGHTMPTSLPETEIARVEDVFKRGIRALGIVNGAAKGDIKVTAGGPVIVEIAARLSGGYMSGWTFPYSSGIEVTEAALHIAMGLPPGRLATMERNVSAERAFISIPGMINSISGYDEAGKSPHIMTTFCRVGPGDTVVFPRNNVEKCGNVISKAPLREEAIVCAEEAVRKIIIRLEPDNRITEDFLFSRSGEPWVNTISAFTLDDPENRNAFEMMIPFICDDKIGKQESITVLPLPSIGDETVRNWHGELMKDAITTLVRIAGIEFEGEGRHGSCILGKSFWRAFLKGGIQGGLYIIDSLKRAFERNLSCKQRLISWED